MLRRKGCMKSNAKICRLCKKSTQSAIRCRQCFGDDILHAWTIVTSVLISALSLFPFPFTQTWTGAFFKPASLKKLGLHVQLGHLPRECCTTPQELHPKFVILHTTGIFEVAINMCDCEHALLAGPDEIQLPARWFIPCDR
ncbi:hypothetical protein MVEN_00848800 [Mycena venus]|uniref:CxC2-like cysteine cluster KDZ transposase-associated domain-containing protein n=1 Tax=Mycena venus TaxID=2733690 RepID=A0A8H7D3G4_9AGAR|nr:hypothetical protein MVEN_00848800 [Mycena venus]